MLPSVLQAPRPDLLNLSCMNLICVKQLQHWL
jgi:hypothetical protein